jgi:hypothetical protein
MLAGASFVFRNSILEYFLKIIQRVSGLIISS